MKGNLMWGLLLASSSTLALEMEPLLYVDSVLYGDSVGGKGGSYAQEALGIYNIHSDGEGGHEGHSHGGLEEGGHVRSIEAGLDWQAGDKLDGRIKGVIMPEDGEAELEEAWARYRLPANTSLKAGKLMSVFGSNNTHPHEWDFVQQNLPVQMLLDGGLVEEGVQLEWQPSVAGTRLKTGVELLDGGNRGIAAQEDSVMGYKTSKGKTANITYPEQPDFPQVSHVYLKADKDIGEQYEISGGLSYLKSRQHQELHQYHPGINEADHGLSGEASMWSVNAAYAHDAGKSGEVGNFKVAAEYLYQNKDLTLNFHEDKPNLVRQPRDLHVDGYAVQGTYRVAPHWQVGLRHERVGATHEARRPSVPTFPTQTSYFNDMKRNTVAVTWQPARQHQLRLEAAHNNFDVAEDTNGDGRSEAVNKPFDQFMLQYQWSLDGGHEHHDH
jgi:hypothetical protein